MKMKERGGCMREKCFKYKWTIIMSVLCIINFYIKVIIVGNIGGCLWLIIPVITYLGESKERFHKVNKNMRKCRDDKKFNEIQKEHTNGKEE